VAWVASGSERWAAAEGASSDELQAAEDRALRALVEGALALGVRWLTVLEPSGGRGLRPAAGELSGRGVTVATLAEPGETVRPPAPDDRLTVLLTTDGHGRAEIVDAVRRLAEDGVAPESVGEEEIGARLGAPDVDLLVHTGDDRHVADLLLWEVAYSELVVLEVPWPAVDGGSLEAAVAEYQGRNRRYGGLVASGGGGR
jgi:undecaprenyl diphosphate synthase